jgi:hypothetical protein
MGKKVRSNKICFEQGKGIHLSMQIATILNEKIKQTSLNHIGSLEQDFVYGEATSKEFINILNSNQVHISNFFERNIENFLFDYFIAIESHRMFIKLYFNLLYIFVQS